MTREEIQIQQIDANIAGLEKRIETIRHESRSMENSELISRLENIILDLKGYREWHQRRLERDQGTT